MRPGSPLPAKRTLVPSRTPAGIFTRYFLTVFCAPEPWQVGHGSSITVPLPPQREHGCEIENRPWPWDSIPRPWHFGHTTGAVPGLAPVPRQVGHIWLVGTETDTCAPSIAWSKLIDTSTSMSRPRSGRGRAGPLPASPPPPNRLPSRSEKSKFAVKPPVPPAPPAPPAPPTPNSPPRSYCLRFSGSPRTS